MKALCGRRASVTMAELQTLMEISEKTTAKEEYNLKLATLMGKPPHLAAAAMTESDPGLVLASVNYDKVIQDN